MLMAHRCVLTAIDLFKKSGGVVQRGRVTTDANEQPMLNNKALEADVIIIATGAWAAELFPRTIKPLSTVVGINVLYTSTPDGSDAFDMDNMPCWIDHGQGSFGLPSSEGSGVKAAVVIPDKIDLENDERLIRKECMLVPAAIFVNACLSCTGKKLLTQNSTRSFLRPIPTLL